MKVVVVGGGVVGLSTAHALLETGCDVTLSDAQAIPIQRLLRTTAAG